MSGGFGAFRPVVVLRAGWHFTPVRTTTSTARNVGRENTLRRSTSTRIYSSPNASSSPPDAGAASFDGDAEA